MGDCVVCLAGAFGEEVFCAAVGDVGFCCAAGGCGAEGGGEVGEGGGS